MIVSDQGVCFSSIKKKDLSLEKANFFLQRFYWAFLLNLDFISWKVPLTAKSLHSDLQEAPLWDVELILQLSTKCQRVQTHRKKVLLNSVWIKWSNFLNKSSLEEQLVVIWHFFFGFDEATIASGLQISRGAVKSRLSRALLRWSACD